MSKKVLVTGGCGFIGHHFVEHVLRNTDWQVAVLDKLSYASNGYDRLRDIDAFDSGRVSVFAADLTLPVPVGLAQEIGPVDYIVHMAAETHVDNSILDPEPFVMSNVVGTMYLLNYARRAEGLEKFIYFSTDEVLGRHRMAWLIRNGTDTTPATRTQQLKRAVRELCLAYANTYKLPVMITHTMNVFGERQHAEKFIPLVIRSVRDGLEVTIHANQTKTKAGSRFYIHARNVASAVLFLLENGESRDKYNIVGEQEVDNLEMARFIAGVVKKPLQYQMTDFHSARPGHDLRYALDGSKMANMGWKMPKTFKESLHKTITWTLEHPEWLK